MIFRWLMLVLVLGLAGCSLPRIIVLNDPLDARQHNDLGVAYEQRHEYDLALREYQRASELDAHWAQPLINQGNVLAGMENWNESAERYRQALEIEPGNAEAMNNLAWVLMKKGDVKDGLEWARKAVARDASNPAFWETLAGLYLASGDPQNADLAARRGLALNPGPVLRRELEGSLIDQP